MLSPLQTVPQRRTLVLTERTPRHVRLSAADVDALLAGHRNHIEIVPTGRAGCYRLTPGGYAGVIVTPTRRLVLRPKIPLRSLLHLLAPDTVPPSVDDATHAVAGDAALNFLAGCLAQRMTERAAAGLHRAYRERGESGPYLQGRLDVAAQARAPVIRKERLHSRFDELTADVPCNQLPKATAEVCLRSSLLGDGARAALRRALTVFAEVASVALTPGCFDRQRLDRLTEPYRPLFDLCRLLTESLTPGEAAGGTVCPAFVLNMEQVFERYVTRGLASAFAGDETIGVSAQTPHVVNRSVAGQADWLMRPDVTLDRDGRPVVVVDAKWKRLDETPLVTEDVYQVLAYCTALGVKRAVLVYPGEKDQGWNYVLRRSPITLRIQMLRVTGSRERCQRSLGRLFRIVCPPTAHGD